MMKKGRFRRRHGLWRRVAAGILLLLLGLGLVPAGAEAAGEEPESAPLSWKTLQGAGPASAGRAVENTYILEVSSGTRQGGGVTDNVLFISVDYTTQDGFSRTAVILPGENEMGRGFDEAAAAGNRNERRREVQEIFGISTPELRDKASLGSMQTDQILFTTPQRIQSVDKIQIFGKQTKAASDWACQGMRICRVDTLYGLEMVGWFSDSGYIDYDGEVIARVVTDDPAGIVFKWDNTAGVHEITGTSFGAFLDNSVRIPHRTQTDNRVIFRLDLADVAGAGFETLAGAYELGGHTKARALQLCECAALTVRYTDTYGCIREAVLPLIVNALGQTIEALGDPEFAEYAQQGDSIALPAMLPDFREIVSVGISLGLQRASEEAKLQISGADGLRAERRRRAENDDISYICFALYRDAEVQVALEGAALRARFLPGSENPIRYSTATGTDGISLEAGSANVIHLQDYYDGMTLSPVDRMERYLITLSTDNVANAGTAGDVILQFKYISIKDKELESEEYSVRDYVREFYGEWPGSAEDFAYRYGFRDGGSVQFIIPLQGVREFTNVSFRLKGNDEWQVTGLKLAMVKSASGRTADWEELSADGLRSHLRYSRRVETKDVAFRVGSVYEETDERPDPLDEDSGWDPGYLIQDDGASHGYSGDSWDVTVKEDVDWTTLRHYMTYAEAQQNLGFTKERFVYEVMVQVAGKTVNPGNDDCGSKNLFYFGLIFENGTSGFTLANQQVQGDAFRTGAEVRFKIPVSQDYGEVTAVQVIPDAQDGNGDIYDKLQIEYISVTRVTEGSVSPTWNARSSSPDGLGWVGIDYRDPGEMGTVAGAQGRSLSELATTYQITETSYSANLLVSITTGDYNGKEQLTGGLAMNVSYFNTEGRMAPSIEGIDVVAAMNSYAGRAGSHERHYMVGNTPVTEAVDYEVSNPAYQFRPGATDSFFITINDVAQLASFTLLVRSNLVTDWTISAINVYQINGTGHRYLNPYGAYDYAYPKGQEPSRIATWTADSLTRTLTVYRSDQNQKDGIASIPIPLDCETIELSKDARSWSSRVLAEPPSHNDTLNLLLYPTTAGNAADPEDYEPTAAVQFTNVNTRKMMQVSTGRMHRAEDENGNTVFYAMGLSANDMDSLNGVIWTADSMRNAQPAITSGVIQRVRGGVLIETYHLTGLGGSLYADTGTTEAENTQRVLLQVSGDTPRQELRPEEKDLAVAVYFRPEGPYAREYRSKYVFLTDLGLREIRPGQVLDLSFALGDVAEITGLNLVTVGKVTVNADGVLAADLSPEGKLRQTRSIRGKLAVDQRPARVDFDGSVQLVELHLTTARNEETAFSGTDGPVRMTLGYYDIYGVLREYTLPDARPYIEIGGGFAAGGTDRIRLLIPELEELRWVELEPLSESGGASSAAETGTDAGTETGEPAPAGTGTAQPALPASWKLESLTAAVGINGDGVTKTVNQRITEGKPLKINLSDITVLGTLTAEAPRTETEGVPQSAEPVKLELANGASETVYVDSGAQLRLTSRVYGSGEGVDVKLQSVDPETGEAGRAVIDETHGHEKAALEEILREAEASAASGLSEEERGAAQAVVKAARELLTTTGRYQRGSTDAELVFSPPRNYTGEKMIYRLTVSAREMQESSFTVDVVIRSEKDPLPDALEAWYAVRAAGTVTLLGPGGEAEETVMVSMGSTHQQLLKSGGALEITPHTLSKGGFLAAIRDLDPVTGATGPAELGVSHGYTEAQLTDLENEARDILGDDSSTEELAAAARGVLDAVERIRNTEGSFDSGEIPFRFRAPRNYSGGTLNYRIGVYDAGTGAAVFQVEVSVKPEDNPLTAALDRLERARSSALAARQAAALQEAIENSGDTYIVSGGETGPAENPGAEGGGGEEPGETPASGETPAPDEPDEPAEPDEPVEGGGD